MRPVLVIPPSVSEAMVVHACACAPRECVGLLSGTPGEVQEAHPLKNVAADANTFAVADDQQMSVRREVRARGAAIVGVYHSHVSAAAYPSAGDVARWFTPRIAHVIVSLAAPSPVVRAFLIDSSANPPVRELGIRLSRDAAAG